MPRSRASTATTAASVPPALSQPIATKRHGSPIDAEPPALHLNPAERVARIVHGRREAMFGCQSVVHRDDDAGGLIGQHATQGIVRIDAADGEAAAVEGQQRQQRAMVRHAGTGESRGV